MASEKQFYGQIEGLRGIAILLVLVSHFVIVPYFAELHFLKFGFWGVNIFFVLSGFLITELLLRALNRQEENKQILKTFYIRRTLRIFPIYYLTIALLFFFNIENAREVTVYTLTYTYNLANVWGGINSNIVTHFWSLCVEEQFYLFWPVLLVFVPQKYFLHLIWFMIIIGLGSRLLFLGFEWPGYERYIWSTAACFDCLGMGALLAWMKTNRPDQLKKIVRYYLIPLIMVTGFFILSKLTGAGDDSFLFAGFGRTMVGITGFFLVGICALETSKWGKHLLTGKLLRFFGRISYGLYVYHWIIFVLLHDSIREWIQQMQSDSWVIEKLKYNTYIVSFVVLTILSVLVASVSYRLIEKPLLRLKERFA